MSEPPEDYRTPWEHLRAENARLAAELEELRQEVARLRTEVAVAITEREGYKHQLEALKRGAHTHVCEATAEENARLRSDLSREQYGHRSNRCGEWLEANGRLLNERDQVIKQRDQALRLMKDPTRYVLREAHLLRAWAMRASDPTKPWPTDEETAAILGGGG